METVACNLCGSKDYEKVYSMPDSKYYPDEWFTVVECRECGLAFVNPRPSFSEIFKYYPDDFYKYFEIEIKLHEKRYEHEAQYLSSITSRKGKKILLDIGCANGDFPRHMQRRYVSYRILL